MSGHRASRNGQPWVQAVVEHWGSSSPEQPWGGFAGQDEQRQRLLARHRRLSMTPDAAAASLAVVGELDVRDALSSVQCPTLVLHRANDIFIDERHSRYAAAHIPGARYVEVSARGQAADEIEQFLTGVRRPILSDRVLATVLFTDIVGSTDRAAELGDSGWRALLERHDVLVREQVERYRGRFVKSLGDGMLAMFDGPSRAISSALAHSRRCPPARARHSRRPAYRRAASYSTMATSAASRFTWVRA